MRIVITRPAGEGQAWVEACQAAGHSTLVLPLIEVRRTEDVQPVVQAWIDWHQWQAVMFVSAQAVRFFFECQPQDAKSVVAESDAAYWGNGPRCWATGPGTHKALLQAGVPEACIDSPAADALQFDSEALWLRVSDQVQPDRPVLIVRGRDAGAAQAGASGSGRDWLSQQLRAAGASAHFVVAYERRAPEWTDQQKADASKAAADASVWCFSSSQAIQHLGRVLPGQNWATARCIATHERIARTAQALGFGEIQLARPGVADILRALTYFGH